jgi:PRTRC genetic system ThiF family protein
MEHQLPTDLTNRAINIHVIGCGGTGSQLMPRLVQLHNTLLALGHRDGLNVTLWDADTVSESNCVRQNFVAVDIGRNKAEITINRLNIIHSLNWEARPEYFTHQSYKNADFFIGCVDTKASRREIAKAVWLAHRCYWVDIGNRRADGQMIVGQAGSAFRAKQNADAQPRLPLVTELLPEIIEGEEDDTTPSCSAAQSILRQGVATNLMGATWAFAWLAEALRHGKIGWSGVFFNLESGRANSIPVDPERWAAMGWQPQKAKRQLRKAA